MDPSLAAPVPARPRSWRRAIVVLLAVLLAIPALVAPRRSEAAATLTGAEEKLTQLINRARVKRGRRALRVGSKITRIARRHSAELRDLGTLRHSDLDRVLRRVTYRVAGENVGMGPNVRDLFRAFMRSPGHRSNILYRPYRRIGVGVKWRNGIAFVTTIFVG